MASLDDLFYFEAVVRHGGFAAAGRALRVPKSKLSRRVASFEERLGVKLLERSTRRLQMTAVGEEVYAHGAVAVAEARAAEEAALSLGAAPRGLVRLGCPPSFGDQALVAVLPAFLAAYRDVNVEIIASIEPIDLVAERVDLVIRADPALAGLSDLLIRKIGTIEIALVASPDFLEAAGPIDQPAELSAHPTISYARPDHQRVWELRDAGGRVVRVAHEPRIIANDFAVIRQSAIQGLGIAMLPHAVCFDAIASGRLVRVLPHYHAGASDMHLMFSSRRGMLPAVRVLIDHLIDALPPLMRRRREELVLPAA